MEATVNRLGTVFCVLILSSWLSGEALAEGPKVFKIVGKAEIWEAAKTRGVPAVVGEALRRGDRIRVAGKGTVVIQKKKTAVEVFVTSDSRLNYLGRSFWKGVERFAVQEGLIRFKIKKGNKLDVKTPHLVASVRGTEFITEVKSDISRVYVVTGRVLTKDFHGRERLLGPNSSISASKDGFVMGEGDPRAEGVEASRFDELTEVERAEKLSSLVAVETDKITVMRAKGMGWGQIAQELGLHPGVLGLGRGASEPGAKVDRGSQGEGRGKGQSQGQGKGEGVDKGKGKGGDKGKGDKGGKP